MISIIVIQVIIMFTIMMLIIRHSRQASRPVLRPAPRRIYCSKLSAPELASIRRTHSNTCFFWFRYRVTIIYNFSGLGVGVVWKLFMNEGSNPSSGTLDTTRMICLCSLLEQQTYQEDLSLFPFFIHSFQTGSGQMGSSQKCHNSP